MNKSKRMLLLTIVSLLLFLASLFSLYRMLNGKTLLPDPISRKAGVLSFEGKNNVIVNQPFTVNVMIDTNNQSVNAAGVYLKFDPEKIQITDISTIASFCQLYPEKKYDNRLGTVSLACGSPHPGFKGVNNLIHLTITPLTIGTTVLRTSSESKLLLSDGKGTNILTDYPSWEVQIGAGL